MSDYGEQSPLMTYGGDMGVAGWIFSFLGFVVLIFFIVFLVIAGMVYSAASALKSATVKKSKFDNMGSDRKDKAYVESPLQQSILGQIWR